MHRAVFMVYANISIISYIKLSILIARIFKKDPSRPGPFGTQSVSISVWYLICSYHVNQFNAFATINASPFTKIPVAFRTRYLTPIVYIDDRLVVVHVVVERLTRKEVFLLGESECSLRQMSLNTN